MKTMLKIATISGMLAVILGAFGAHVLKGIIDPEMLEVYKTGVQYQFYHTFALFVTAILMKFSETKVLKWSAYFFVVGLILFSGSLYLLAVTGIKILGIITPFGGMTWIAAWILLFVHCSRSTGLK